MYDVTNLENYKLQYTYFPVSQKVNETWFGQLIEYNMKNTFLEKLYTKCGGEFIIISFSNLWKLSISLD